MTAPPLPRYSFVIPIYNEEETLPELHRRISELLARLDGDAEVILVDDGSRDRSYALMLGIHTTDPRFKVVHFARNFGHQIAISAGMDLARGDATIIMDADLQDPPEVVLKMVERWQEGYDIVYAVRDHREGESWLKLMTARLFYRVLRRLTEVEIPVDVGDFRLVDRRAMDAFRALRESSRYVRGMFSWIGFRQTGVHYARPGRYAGTTKYPFRKMIRLAVDGIISFSNLPLRAVLKLGFFVSVISFVAGIAAIIIKLSGAFAVPGWASLTVVVSFLGGVQLTVMGVMGEYVGRIYEEVKHRPLYVVRRAHGFVDSGEPQQMGGPALLGVKAAAPVVAPGSPQLPISEPAHLANTA